MSHILLVKVLGNTCLVCKLSFNLQTCLSNLSVFYKYVAVES
jgi:hypothetical protein